MSHEMPLRSEPGRCRSCGAQDLALVVDLGPQPPAGNFPLPDESESQALWQLTAVVCRTCWLLQLRDPTPDEPAAASIQTTVSSTMAVHAAGFVDEVLASRNGAPTRILEVASHGGHLAPLFAAQGVRTLLIDASEPLVNSARAAGLDAETATLTNEATRAIRASRGTFDIIIDSYLLAHERQLDPELAAIATLLAERGQAVLEFNHLLPLIRGSQFDAIRHGHFSYLSLIALVRALERNGLHAVSGSVQPVYGGGVRLWVAHQPAPTQDPILRGLLAEEEAAGLGDEAAYRRFEKSVGDRRQELHAFLADAASAGRQVVGYGAPSRGSTLLNACGITPALLAYTVDASRAKQGRLMPGSGIPIVEPARIVQDKPDEVLVLTWDLIDEVVHLLPEVHSWGGRFATPFPTLSFR